RPYVSHSSVRLPGEPQLRSCLLLVFFSHDSATTEIYTLSLHDALPISASPRPPWTHSAQRSPPDPGRTRRHHRTAALARWPGTRHTGSPPPAPVRRRRSAPVTRPPARPSSSRRRTPTTPPRPAHRQHTCSLAWRRP